jgi:transcriptional regulator of acetoin/glycerol metabolism
MRRLLAYDWPGNVRELKNYVGYLSFAMEGGEILEEHLPPEVLNGGSRLEECPAPPSEPGSFESIERAFLVDTVRKLGGNAVEAAKTLGISRSTLYRKLKKHGISC